MALDLDAIKKRLAVASPGPWIWCLYDLESTDSTGHSHILLSDKNEFNRIKESNRHFISHSRQDIPALIEEVESLRAEVEKWKGREAGMAQNHIDSVGEVADLELKIEDLRDMIAYEQNEKVHAQEQVKELKERNRRLEEVAKAASDWRKFGPYHVHNTPACECDLNVGYDGPECLAFDEFLKALAALKENNRP